VAKLAAGNTGVNVVETIITDGAPESVVSDLQTTFMLCCTADKSQAYSSSCHSTSQQRAVKQANLKVKVNS